MLARRVRGLDKLERDPLSCGRSTTSSARVGNRRPRASKRPSDLQAEPPESLGRAVPSWGSAGSLLGQQTLRRTVKRHPVQGRPCRRRQKRVLPLLPVAAEPARDGPVLHQSSSSVTLSPAVALARVQPAKPAGRPPRRPIQSLPKRQSSRIISQPTPVSRTSSRSPVTSY